MLTPDLCGGIIKIQSRVIRTRSRSMERSDAALEHRAISMHPITKPLVETSDSLSLNDEVVC